MATIHPYALDIIEGYSYILPQLSNTKLNKQIKKVCEYAEIDERITELNKSFHKYELVTCHTAMRSFATNGYLSDVPVRDLMRITGYKKETTFLDCVQVKREVRLSRILEIYPNPSRDIFNVSFTSVDRQDLRVRILNIIGEELLSENLEQFIGEYTKQIDLTNNAKGIYFLEIETNDGVINKNLILQ